jgi:hypothetical protein
VVRIPGRNAAADTASITSANSNERTGDVVRILLPLAGSSLGLPGGALLLRVAWMERPISGRNVLHTRIAGKWFRNELSHLGTFMSDQKRSV